MSTKEVNQQFGTEDHAKVYSIYRPDQPDEVVQIALRYLREKYAGELNLALDVGCGSGQSSVILSPFFQRVVGIDSSEAQIKEAINSRKADNVEYKVQAAETLPLADASTQMITASSCLHWFQLDSFFPEARRILVPGGVMVVYSYHKILPLTEDEEKNEKLRELVKELYGVTLKQYLAEEVQCCLDNYVNVDFPFEDVTRLKPIRQTFPGKLSDVIGYMTTLSGFQNFKRERGPEAGSSLIQDLCTRMSNILELKPSDFHTAPLTLYRDFYVILCRKEGNNTKN